MKKISTPLLAFILFLSVRGQANPILLHAKESLSLNLVHTNSELLSSLVSSIQLLNNNPTSLSPYLISLNSNTFYFVCVSFIALFLTLGFLLIKLNSKYRIEKSLRENAENYSNLFNDNHSIMLINDPVLGQVVEANKAACNFYDYNYDDIRKLKLEDIFKNQDIDTTGFLKECMKRSTQVQAKNTLKSGDIKDVEIHASRIKFNNEIYVFTIIHDISERVKQQKQLIEARKKAEESDILKSAFLANMSHEIRTPMNIILGFSSLLSDTEIDYKTYKKYLKLIQDNGEHLMNLINDIIDLSKIEANQLKIEIKECKLNQLMEDIYILYQNQMSINSSKNEIKLILKKGIENPDFSISTDPIRLKQILINLLGNALKFTDKGEINFGYVFRDDSVLQFFVKDTGIGIPENRKKSIFTAFEQVEDSSTRNYGGTGLGLSICRSLVEKLGGHIWVMSKLGEGSRFYFTISTITNPLNLD